MERTFGDGNCTLRSILACTAEICLRLFSYVEDLCTP